MENQYNERLEQIHDKILVLIDQNERQQAQIETIQSENIALKKKLQTQKEIIKAMESDTQRSQLSHYIRQNATNTQKMNDLLDGFIKEIDDSIALLKSSSPTPAKPQQA